MKILRIVLCVVAALILLALSGYLLPVKHTATVNATIHAPAAVVWSLIANPEGYIAWRTDLARVEIADDGKTWTEYDTQGDSLTYAALREEKPTLFETRIEDTDKPFGGGWVIVLRQDSTNDDTVVTVTEHGEVYNPVYRIISRFIIGHTATAERYLANLKKTAEK